MPDRVKEKLIDLILGWGGMSNCAEDMADYFMSHGVTVQEWISVTADLPKLIPCGADTAYSEAVNVLTSGRKVLTAIWDGLIGFVMLNFGMLRTKKSRIGLPYFCPCPNRRKENNYGRII